MILAPVTPSIRPADQVATRAYLAEHEHVRILCENPTDYADALLAAWPLGQDLVIIEHDIVPRLDTLAGFAVCPQPFCTAPYWLFGGAVSLLDPVTQVTLGGAPADYSGQLLDAISGLGCVRLLASYREWIDTTSFAGVFDGLDVRVSRAILAAGWSWHVHPPVEHTGRP